MTDKVSCKRCNDKGHFRINGHEFTCDHKELTLPYLLGLTMSPDEVKASMDKHEAAVQRGFDTIRAIIGDEEFKKHDGFLFAPAWFMDDSKDNPE